MADEAEKKKYEVIKPIRSQGKSIIPASAGQPPVLVALRDDQARNLALSEHINKKDL